jgi:predicted nuclease of predicted toxin-antitoxin system
MHEGLRFLIDAQLPPNLAHWIQSHGQFAEHVLDLNLAQSKDSPIWLYATEHNSVIVSKDEDFAEWVRRGRPGPSVVWLRCGNASTRALLAWLDPLFPLIVDKLGAGERLIEVR